MKKYTAYTAYFEIVDKTKIQYELPIVIFASTKESAKRKAQKIDLQKINYCLGPFEYQAIKIISLNAII